jgi:3-oxoadipate enol-lactonase
MAYAERNGTSLWYELEGRGETLTLIGGFAMVQDQFAPSMPYLTKNFRTLNWNYRGVGRADWSMTEPYTLEGWVEDLRAVLDHARIRTTHLWCTSTGSALGVRFASKYPERVKSLVTYPWVRSDEAWRNIFDVAHGVGSRFGLRALSRLFFSVVVPTEDQYTAEGMQLERWLADSFERNVNPATLRNVADAFANLELTGDVRRLKCPTLLLLGDEAPLNVTRTLESTTFETLVSEFQSLKSDVELAAIHGAASTYCMLTKPEESSRLVTEFIKRQGRKADAQA